MALGEDFAATLELPVLAVQGDAAHARADAVVVEEPLELRLRGGFAGERTLSITMRTPGGAAADRELGLGFLFGEGVIRGPGDVIEVEQPDANVVVMTLSPELPVAWRGLERNVYTTSACGICGKSAIAALAATPAEPLATADLERRLDPAILHSLPHKLRAAQTAFSTTGGLHAAGLFSPSGELLTCREDVGRHNAVDKLIGARFSANLQKTLTLHDTILCVSGRASFELLQKARMACVPIFVAVGAPSSLAVTLARESSMTLVGFARDGRCNVYSAPERLALRATSGAPSCDR